MCPYQGRAGSVLGDVLQHSIKYKSIQFCSGRRVVAGDYTQEFAYLLLHLGASVAEVKVHEFLDDVSCHELSSSLQAMSEGLEKCDAVFSGSRATSETVALVHLDSGEWWRLK